MEQGITPALRRFARKVRWEGGVLGAIDYGLHRSDVPDEDLADTWARIEDLYAEMAPLVAKVESAIADA